MKALILGMVAALGLTGSAFAGNYEWRQYRQGDRIADGYYHGQLTNRETRQLLRGQSRVNRAEYRAERDGVITQRERRKLERLQDRQSNRIHRKKHNDRSYW
jgi:hypothetical protein